MRSDIYNLGFIAFVAGFVMAHCAWWLYRKPGVPYRTVGFLPWQAKDYMEPIGVSMMRNGLIAAITGFVMMTLTMR